MPLPGVIGSLLGGGTEYPVLLYGLDGAGKTTLIVNWCVSSGQSIPLNHADRHVDKITMKLEGRDRITFVASTRRDGLVSPQHMRSVGMDMGKAGLLFLHDATDSRLDESIALLHERVREHLCQYGGRGIWVVINKMDRIPEQERAQKFYEFEIRFGLELSMYPDPFRWHVLSLPEFAGSSRMAALKLVEMLGQELPLAPVFKSREMAQTADNYTPTPTGATVRPPTAVPATWQSSPDLDKDRESVNAWWDNVLHGKMQASWNHVDYLRAIFMTILEARHEGAGILDVATAVAKKVHDFKQRFVSFQLHPESRTLTVFWVYHVKLALDSYTRNLGESKGQKCWPTDFSHVVEHMPELLDEKLHMSFFSTDLLASKYPEMFWMLPDLRILTEFSHLPSVPQTSKKVTLQTRGDPDRILRFAFEVVQRYLRKDSTQRRSFFIDQGFATLQQRLILLRRQDPSIPAYSVTHIYFFVQLVHLALSSLLSAGMLQDEIHNLHYRVFRDLCKLSPTVWTTYYTHTSWFSLPARINFLSPDLRPLPNRLPLLSSSLPTIPTSKPYHHLALLPEIPSIETLNFHLSILLNLARTLPTPLPPSSVTTHPALLSYIHTNILSCPSPPPSLIKQHISLLTTSTPFPPSYITFFTTFSLSLLHTNPLPTSPSPPSFFRPITTSPTTGQWTRYHNCPCHPSLPMTPKLGPSAVCYPFDYPYEHPPQHTHSCICHKGEEIDHDKFAELCAEGYANWDVDEKRTRGLVPGVRTLGKDPWEGFMRLNGLLAWEGLWEVVIKRMGEGLGEWLGGVECEEGGWLEVGDEGGGDGGVEGEDESDGMVRGDGAGSEGLNEGHGVGVNDDEDDEWDVVTVAEL